MGTCITSCWTLAQGRSDRCTVKADGMVKKVALSLLALIPFLSITGYVIPSISHSSRFRAGSEQSYPQDHTDDLNLPFDDTLNNTQRGR